MEVIWDYICFAFAIQVESCIVENGVIFFVGDFVHDAEFIGDIWFDSRLREQELLVLTLSNHL